MADGILTNNTPLEYEDPDVAATWIAINCPGDWEIPGQEQSYIEDERHCDGGYMQKFPGTRNIPSFSVPVRHDGAQASHAFLMDRSFGALQTAPLAMRATLANGETFTFSAFVSFGGTTVNVQGIAETTYNFEPTGAMGHTDPT